MLSLSKVRAGYGETVVLEDVDLELPERGSLAVLGRNGVGKTTLLATIMGHTTFHSGGMAFNRTPISGRPVYERSKLGIGYVPQERMIFPSLTVHENLDVARRPGRWTLDAVYQLFPRLKERRTAYGNQLSGGEQQMLAIGRALMGNPSLLLMDEPLEGLAPIIVESLLLALKKLVSDEPRAGELFRAERRAAR
jgi:branched-chain amino acid transport system ATP-binding protein